MMGVYSREIVAKTNVPEPERRVPTVSTSNSCFSRLKELVGRKGRNTNVGTFASFIAVSRRGGSEEGKAPLTCIDRRYIDTERIFASRATSHPYDQEDEKHDSRGDLEGFRCLQTALSVDM